MAKRGNGAAILALGAVGVAGWALLRSGRTAAALSNGVQYAADGAGRGAPALQEQSNTPAHTATGGAPTVSQSWSELWGRDVRQALAVGGPGTRLTAADSEGRHILLTAKGLEAATRSSLWLTRAGVQRIPWDTNPLSYFWDGGKPHGTDPSATTAPGRNERLIASGSDLTRIDNMNVWIAENATGLKVPTTPIYKDPVQWFKELW